MSNLDKSKQTRLNKPAKPKFSLNECIDQLVIIKYLGWIKLSEEQRRNEHCYIGKCSCGEERTVAQGYLISNSYKRCMLCSRRAQATAKPDGKRKQTNKSEYAAEAQYIQEINRLLRQWKIPGQ